MSERWPLFVLLGSLGALIAVRGLAGTIPEAPLSPGASTGLVRLLGFPDLALSSSSRWLRHPSQAELGAAFADAPGSFDTDPAGAWVGPPRALLIPPPTAPVDSTGAERASEGAR